MNRIFALLLLLLSLSIFSCRKTLERPQWETNVLVPIAKTSLSINDLVADSLTRVDSNNLVILSYTQNVFTTSPDSLVKLDAPSYEEGFSLESLELDPVTVATNTTLGEIARSIGPPEGDLILSLHGQTTIFPGYTGVTAGPFPVNATQYFETATLIEGYMDLCFTNGFATAVNNVEFELRNENNNALIANVIFPTVAAGATECQTIDLAGQTIEGTLEANLLNLDIPFNLSLAIDTNDVMTSTVVVRDVKIQEATAIFPRQEVFSDTLVTNLKNDYGVILTEAIVKSGTVHITAFNTIQDTLEFNFRIPVATLAGNEFSVVEFVPPAPDPFTPSTLDVMYDFSGYQLDLTGMPPGSDTNAIHSVLSGVVDSNGELIFLSLRDSLNLQIELVDLVVSYGKGYLGQITETVGPAIQQFNVMNDINLGNVDFETASLSLNIENGIGVEGEITINDLTATNTSTGQSVTLDISSLPNPIPIGKAIEIPFTPSLTAFSLDDGNSNTSSLIEISPDQLSYEVSVEINPNGNDGSFSDFVICPQGLSADMELEIPLSLSTSNLVLSDTTAFDITTINDDGIEETPIDDVKEGTLSFIVNNGFPLEATFEFIFLNSNRKPIDSLVTNDRASAAPVNANGRVTGIEKSKLSFFVPEARMKNIANAQYIIINTIFDTKPNNTFVKFYDNYIIDITIVGDFIYQVRE